MENYTREYLIDAFSKIGEPKIYEIDLIDKKTKLIKKIQKKYNLNYNEIKNLYKVNYENLNHLIEILI